MRTRHLAHRADPEVVARVDRLVVIIGKEQKVKLTRSSLLEFVINEVAENRGVYDDPNEKVTKKKGASK